MANEKNSSTKICPTCGTRLSADAARCLVCGTNLSTPEKEARPGKAVQGSRMPEVTLSLPLVIGLFALFLVIGAILVYVALGQAAAPAAQVTDTPTITPTTTSTLTPTPLTPTPSNTPEPTLTPLSYTVKLGDNCGSIAYAFKVSVLSIVMQNNLPADCSTLIEGQLLQVPQPTATVTPLPTATLNSNEATEAACPKDFYTVQENDTLGGISLNYNVPMEDIREYNGLVSDVVRFGQQLVIPLCQRANTGPTPTPTLPPPYPAVSLLLPPDGAAYTLVDDVATLQWNSVGVLRENEAYAVTIEDVTEGQGRKLLQYVLDTKFIVPISFRSGDGVPHAYRWWVVTVRQNGTDEDGNPIWEPAGAVSGSRVFIWAGSAQVGTPVP